MFASLRVVARPASFGRRYVSTVNKPHVEAFWHGPTFNWTYVVSDPTSKVCAIIDPVLDWNPDRFATSSEFADGIVKHVQDRGLETAWILVCIVGKLNLH